ncbi:MAG: SGNH/GDSL hydrolase family protein [Akkermansiaceae bacterium]
MKKLTITTIIFIFLTACLSAAALDALDTELKKKWPNNRTINIVFHGHSVPSGYHLSPQVKPFESYPHLFRAYLKERYPFAVVNIITTGIGGENSIEGAARFSADVLSRKPDLIFIDYALNDRPEPIANVEAAWRSMVDAAQAASVPVVLITPSGATDADFTNASDPLTIRAALIRTVASSEGVLLADVSADWMAALQGGTAQGDLLSQINHPNLAGHQLAANTLFDSISAATDTVTTRATEFTRDGSVNTHASSDGRLNFTTTSTFSGQDDYLGDSGGTDVRTDTYDGSETLQVALNASTHLYSFGLRHAEATVTITGFASDPGARVGTVNNVPGTVTWDEPSKTLTLGIPWDENKRRHVTFTNPAATNGKTLTFSFTNNGARIHQVAFTDFTHQIITP